MGIHHFQRCPEKNLQNSLLLSSGWRNIVVFSCGSENSQQRSKWFKIMGCSPKSSKSLGHDHLISSISASFVLLLRQSCSKLGHLCMETYRGCEIVDRWFTPYFSRLGFQLGSHLSTIMAIDRDKPYGFFTKIQIMGWLRNFKSPVEKR